MEIMSIEAVGTVIKVKKQWWLKVNTKPIRRHSLDGAVFPHIITVKYNVSVTDYTKKKWVKAKDTPPEIYSEVRVIFEEGNPKKARISY